MNAPTDHGYFNVHDAKTNLSRLMERAHAGEEIVLAKAGKPYAKLVPYVEAPKLRRRPGGLTLVGQIPDSVWDPLSEDEQVLWEGDGLEKHGS